MGANTICASHTHISENKLLNIRSDRIPNRYRPITEPINTAKHVIITYKQYHLTKSSPNISKNECQTILVWHPLLGGIKTFLRFLSRNRLKAPHRFGRYLRRCTHRLRHREVFWMRYPCKYPKCCRYLPSGIGTVTVPHK